MVPARQPPHTSSITPYTALTVVVAGQVCASITHSLPVLRLLSTPASNSQARPPIAEHTGGEYFLFSFGIARLRIIPRTGYLFLVLFVGMVPVPFTVTWYHTPGDDVWGSKKLTTRCVILRGCDIQRTLVITSVIVLGFDKAYHQGDILKGV